MKSAVDPEEIRFLRRALDLARRGYGHTSPNPMVGAVLVKQGRVIGQGWHRRAGAPHAEIEAMRDAAKRGFSLRGSTLYVTLEPCCTTGRTPPCTDSIARAGIRRVVAAATDPNPNHAGRGFELLRRAGVRVAHGLLAEAATRLNEPFNHWIRHHTPFVTAKAAMTLDGKIATTAGESKWITGESARRHAMELRAGADAILVGVNTVLADDPSLTVRNVARPPRSGTLPSGGGWVGLDLSAVEARASAIGRRTPRRLVLDALGRTPLDAQLVSDQWRVWTTVFVGPGAPVRRREALARRVNMVVVPKQAELDAFGATRRGAPEDRSKRPRLDLRWILRQLGQEGVTSLLVEGGGEVNASFLEQGLVHRVAFYYAPKVLGEAAGRRGVAGTGLAGWPTIARLGGVEWCRLGADLFLTARVGGVGGNRTAK